jgi:cytochrome c-type biogenesis protein CcmH/NrfG
LGRRNRQHQDELAAELRNDPAARQNALAAGDLVTAESAFRHVLTLDPQSGAAYANLGVVAMRQKMWDEALLELRKAERLAPKMTGVRLNIALVEFRRGNYRQAIVPFQCVLRETPARLNRDTYWIFAKCLWRIM